MSDLSLTAISTIFADYKTSFVGKGLQNSEPVLNKKGRPIFRKGNQCGVTKLRYPAGNFKALRMWQTESANSNVIYKHISKYIEQNPTPYLLNLSYQKDTIKFNGEYFSALLMDWCSGCSLREYLNSYIANTGKLTQLKNAIEGMFKDMNQRGISHGDIHHNNICISEHGEPILIDYDSMFVPSLKGIEDDCLGYSGYQLPGARENNKYLSHKTDYFSQLIVILTLECLIQKPSLWNSYLDEDDTVSLIFKKEDFENLKKSKIYLDIRDLKGDVPFLLSVLEQYMQKTSINDLWPYYETNKSQQSIYCIKCGHKIINTTDKYCTECGSLIYYE